MIEGGCYCQKIRYTLTEGNYLVANCHCTICRKTSAAPFVPWIILPAENFHFSRGEPAMLESSNKGTRYFCRDCGTPLLFKSRERSHQVDLTVCSLDKPELFPPMEDAYTDTRLEWSTNSANPGQEH